MVQCVRQKECYYEEEEEDWRKQVWCREREGERGRGTGK